MVRIPVAEPQQETRIANLQDVAGSGWGAPGRAMQQLGGAIADLGGAFSGLAEKQSKLDEFEDRVLGLQMKGELDVARAQYDGTFAGTPDEYAPGLLSTTGGIITNYGPRFKSEGGKRWYRENSVIEQNHDNVRATEKTLYLRTDKAVTDVRTAGTTLFGEAIDAPREDGEDTATYSARIGGRIAKNAQAFEAMVQQIPGLTPDKRNILRKEYADRILDHINTLRGSKDLDKIDEGDALMSALPRILNAGEPQPSGFEQKSFGGYETYQPPKGAPQPGQQGGQQGRMNLGNPPGDPGEVEFNPQTRQINPVSFHGVVTNKVASSGLVGTVPKWGPEAGITTGSAEEWGRFFTALMKSESGFMQSPKNPDGTLARLPGTIATENSFGPGQFNVGEYGLKTWDDVNNPTKVADAMIQVAKADKIHIYFGPVKNIGNGWLKKNLGWFDSEIAPNAGSVAEGGARKPVGATQFARDQATRSAGIVDGQGPFPVGGSMAGKTWADVPSSGGAPRSREWGGPRKGGQHAGIDIPGRTGDPVYALTGGQVLKAGVAQGYGNYVDVRAPDGSVHRFAHLSSIGVRAGQKLEPGATVGGLGDSGNAKGWAHLHLEVFKDERAYSRASEMSSRASWNLRMDPRQYYAGLAKQGDGRMALGGPEVEGENRDGTVPTEGRVRVADASGGYVPGTPVNTTAGVLVEGARNRADIGENSFAAARQEAEGVWARERMIKVKELNEANTGGYRLNEDTIAYLQKEIEKRPEIAERTGLKAQFEQAVRVGTILDHVKQLPPADFIRFMDNWRSEISGATRADPFDIAAYEAADKLRKEMIETVKRDAYEWEERIGSSIEPITIPDNIEEAAKDPALLAGFEAQIQRRSAIAQTMKEKYGVEQILRPQEREKLMAVLKQGGENMIETIGLISKTAGPQVASKVFSELKGASPEMAWTGDLAVRVGPGLAGSGSIVRDLAEGQRMKMAQEKDGATKPKITYEPSEKDLIPAVREVLGSTNLTKGEVDTLVSLATTAYTVRAAREYADTFNTDLFQKTLHEVLGRNEQTFTTGNPLSNDVEVRSGTFGGPYTPKGWSPFSFDDDPTIVLPHYVNADKMGEIREAMTIEDLQLAGLGIPFDGNGLPVPIEDIRNAKLVQIGDPKQGRYLLATGDPKQPGAEKFVNREPPVEGQRPVRFIIEMDKLAPVMAARNPAQRDWFYNAPKLEAPLVFGTPGSPAAATPRNKSGEDKRGNVGTLADRERAARVNADVENAIDRASPRVMTMPDGQTGLALGRNQAEYEAASKRTGTQYDPQVLRILQNYFSPKPAKEGRAASKKEAK